VERVSGSGLRALRLAAVTVAVAVGVGAWREGMRRRRSERQLAAEHAVTCAIAESASLDAAGPRILEAVADCLGWERGNLWLVERDGAAIVCAQRWLAPGLEGGEFERAGERLRLGCGAGLPGRVWNERRPIWLPHLSSLARAAEATDAGIVTAYAFPVLASGEPVGVMEFFGSGSRTPDAGTLEMLASIGAEVGEYVRRDRGLHRLAESEARKAAMLESALDCIITADRRGRILEWNPAAERTFGWRREEVVGRELVDVIVPDDLRTRHRAGLERVAAGGQPHILGRRVDMRGRRSDGTEFPLELTVVRVAGEEPPLFTAYVRDLSERVAVQGRLEEAERQRSRVLSALVLSSEEERSRIAVELHDDTVQVMTATLLSLDRLARALDRHQPERARRAVESAREALGAAVDRTRRLMFELRPPLLVEQGLAAALAEMAEQVELECGLVAHLDLEPGRYPDATESLVYRTVLEAVANVRRHAGASGLWIALEERDGRLDGEVRDDGRGFDPVLARRRPGRRLHLGLDAAAERCRLAGGDLDVQSGTGHGTRVAFSVPILQDPRQSPFRARPELRAAGRG
jgi:PAS domain S-box-containing protein